MDAAVWQVWTNSSLGNEYSLADTSFPKFLASHCQGKRLSVGLIDDCWKIFKKHQAQREIAAKFGGPTNPRDVQAALDDADDDTIRQAFWKTARYVARAAK